MIIHEHSDVMQWGLQLLDGDPNNSGYCGEIIHHSADDAYNGIYQENYDTNCSHLENDEVIARTLQEEFSQLAVSEASRYSHAGGEQFQASNLEHDWHGPSVNYNCSGIQLSSFMDFLTVISLLISVILIVFITMCSP